MRPTDFLRAIRVLGKVQHFEEWMRQLFEMHQAIVTIHEVEVLHAREYTPIKIPISEVHIFILYEIPMVK